MKDDDAYYDSMSVYDRVVDEAIQKYSNLSKFANELGLDKTSFYNKISLRTDTLLKEKRCLQAGRSTL